MRAVSILAILIAIFAVGCGQKVVDDSKLVKRGGLYYEVNSEDPFSGTMVAYYSNGQKKGEAEYRYGKKHGKFIKYYENGQKENESEYRDGLEQGEATNWYENGQKQLESEWRDGKLHGKATSWYENGQKQAEAEYRDGELISVKGWDKNGNPK